MIDLKQDFWSILGQMTNFACGRRFRKVSMHSIKDIPVAMGTTKADATEGTPEKTKPFQTNKSKNILSPQKIRQHPNSSFLFYLFFIRDFLCFLCHKYLHQLSGHCPSFTTIFYHFFPYSHKPQKPNDLLSC